jgi:hypothetical protein
VIQTNLRKKFTFLILSLLFTTTVVVAGARHFTFLYEAPTSAPGSIESENWITWEPQTNPDRSDRIGFRHEIEIGVTEHLQAGIYFVDWSYQSDRSRASFNYSDSAIELIYNLTLDAEWEGQGLQERKGELQQALGASYELSPRMSVGVEFLHEFVFPHWRDEEKIRNVFVGPNVAFRHQNWFVIVTALAQATDTPHEADFKVRTIFGFGF